MLVWLHEKERKAVHWTTMVQRVKFAVLFLVLVHWIACALHLAACFRGCPAEGTWRTQFGAEGTSDSYLTAVCATGFFLFFLVDETDVSALQLYWSITSFLSVGYGDIVAQTLGEMLLIVAVMLLGTLLSGYDCPCSFFLP